MNSYSSDVSLLSYSAGEERQSWTIKAVPATCQGVTIWKKTSDLPIGESHTFKAAVYSTNLHEHGGGQFTWVLVSGSQYATLSEEGTLEGEEERSTGEEWPAAHTVYIERLPNPNAQNKTHWCWVACAKMVGEHNGGSGSLETGASLLDDQNDVHAFDNALFYGQRSNGKTVDAGQRQIVVAIHGDDGNYSGDNEDREQALQLASRLDMDIGTIGNGTRLNDTDIATMHNELNAGRWVLGTLFSPYDDTGHCIVIKSYDENTGKYDYWDPWNNQEDDFTHSELERSEIQMEYEFANTGDCRLAWVQYCR